MHSTKSSKGTRYENFCRDIADYEIKGVSENAPAIFSSEQTDAMELFVEKITYAFYESLFSTIIEDVDLKTAIEYVSILTKFYDTGISMCAGKILAFAGVYLGYVLLKKHLREKQDIQQAA